MAPGGEAPVELPQSCLFRALTPRGLAVWDPPPTEERRAGGVGGGCSETMLGRGEKASHAPGDRQRAGGQCRNLLICPCDAIVLRESPTPSRMRKREGRGCQASGGPLSVPAGLPREGLPSLPGPHTPLPPLFIAGQTGNPTQVQEHSPGPGRINNQWPHPSFQTPPPESFESQP